MFLDARPNFPFGDFPHHLAVNPADSIDLVRPIRFVMWPAEPRGLMFFPFRGQIVPQIEDIHDEGRAWRVVDDLARDQSVDPAEAGRRRSFPDARRERHNQERRRIAATADIELLSADTN